MAFPTGWGRKVKITIPDAQITGSNTDFPVLLTESELPVEMLDGGANSALNGGGDVRFSEDAAGSTRLDLEIVTFVTGGTPDAELWVKMPTLNTGAAKEFYAWYKKAAETQPAVTAAFGRNAVWADYFRAWHLTDGLVDSTGNSTDLTAGGSVSPTQDALGFDFTGGDGFLEHDSGPVNGSTTFTLLGAQYHTTTASQAFIAVANNSVFDQHTYLRKTGVSPGTGMFGRNSGEAENDTTNDTATTPDVGSLLIGAGSFNASTDATFSYIHHNTGPSDKATATGTYDWTPVSTDKVRLGSTADSSVDTYADCIMAWCRIYNGLLTEDWLDTVYANLSDTSTFASAGTPEDVDGGPIAILLLMQQSFRQ